VTDRQLWMYRGWVTRVLKTAHLQVVTRTCSVVFCSESRIAAFRGQAMHHQPAKHGSISI